MTEKPHNWIGKSQSRADITASGPLKRLAALLDHEAPPWPQGEVPPLAHWLYFLPDERLSDLDADGHPRRGGFLPPSPHSRRMWAGGQVEFVAPLTVGVNIVRKSMIQDVSVKNGSQGEMLIVKVAHDVFAGETPVIREVQNLIYLNPAPQSEKPEREASSAETKSFIHKRRHVASTVELFRFSALTFNSHRIHYDQAYAQGVEHYPGLVVHGPYSATLLMDFFLQNFPGRCIKSFGFRAKSPLFSDQPFDLHIDGSGPNYSLWICNDKGVETMSASIQAD
ncbi:MaoC family dehydratase N-terminal domain-containing protein [Marinicaulis aureus]|uniref:MaoC family dehydratase N-terminal domain-containing protein n=1 Tax=Hyphococcus aureus TaxID=2666033 RepID=A0ABW1KUH2_9PROT